MKNLVVLFSVAFLTFSLTACSDKGSEQGAETQQTQVEHAKVPAGEVKEAPVASEGYDPTKDEDGDC